MPIVVRAKKNQSIGDLIKTFKKMVAMSDVVQIVKDRRFYIKPSQIKAAKVTEFSRLRRRSRSLKKMKNVSPQVVSRINDRLAKRGRIATKKGARY